jgi:malate dehydrogenase (oxaloacetate-decarboxylating)
LDFQKPYVKDDISVKRMRKQSNGEISLIEVVKKIKPTTLIGCSGMAGAFTDDVITSMASTFERPIIFPLSNPTEKCERQPVDIVSLTDGKALIATGSPFEAVGFKGKVYRISQCNNALVFPGIGLGVVALKSKSLNQNMLWAACRTLANYPVKDDGLLPELNEAYTVSRQVAFAVARQSVLDGLSTVDGEDDIWELIGNTIWEPKYYPYRKV